MEINHVKLRAEIYNSLRVEVRRSRRGASYIGHIIGYDNDTETEGNIVALVRHESRGVTSRVSSSHIFPIEDED